MYKFILVILLPLVLLLTSCATTSSSKNYKTLSEQIGINDQAGGAEIAPKIEILDPLQNSTGTSTPKKRNPTIALFLGPGLYHAFAYVEVFKAFEKHQLPISMVSGSEFGLFLSALYAKHGKASLVEWRIFSLLQKMDEDGSGDFLLSSLCQQTMGYAHGKWGHSLWACFS